MGGDSIWFLFSNLNPALKEMKATKQLNSPCAGLKPYQEGIDHILILIFKGPGNVKINVDS